MKHLLTSLRHNQVYRVDLLMLAMFAGVMLDTCTTWVFISRHLGTEMNPVLGPLARNSLLWIPFYLLCRPVAVPLLPEHCRFAFAVYFGLQGWLSGLNNLGGIFYGNYFLVDRFGFAALEGAYVIVGIAAFIWRLWRRAGDDRERLEHLLAGLFCAFIFGLLEVLFQAAGRESWH